MNTNLPSISSKNGTRKFTCFAAGVLGFIINEKEEILLLSHRNEPDQWQVINGALESDETILEGVLREIQEEAGSDLKVKPLGTIHTYSHHYDQNVRYMIVVCDIIPERM